MGKEIKVLQVEAENGGTLIQVDFEVENKKDRMFIEVSDIFKALNNCLYQKQDDEMIKLGAELLDPENYKNPNLLNYDK